MKVEDLAYAAGFLDGEGCFTFTYSPTVKCAHTHRPTLEWLMLMFGGNIREHNCKTHKKQAWVWAVHGKTAGQLCEALIPYLKEKKGQAELLLAFLETIQTRGVKVSPEILAYRERLKDELKSMRHSPR